ncbi:hypothetical protein GLAREA_07962 [Glarea lozoyensis ATCC 20868]|uniref:Metalloproteases (Zincins), catalytic n=1 Tax=Glarea lozoyensis (strain ATCC 20868 / MF5171) TaxID=1116229 RepID=S3CBZ4_GLAL2|nr:uncharacterized protein GLAREA_07962 [Glarea lozoyensis ATCC 20868]EPE24112.1 hypothetical protein GLAREA_07962 [Glarea lozoyensis ATCC 20868]
MHISIPIIAIWLEFFLVNSSPQPPQPSPPPSYSFIPNSKGFLPFSLFLPRIFIDHTCSEAQKILLQQAWDEAQLLAKAQTGFLEGYDYGAVHQIYLGDEWNALATSHERLARTRSTAIFANFNRLKMLFEGPVSTDEFIYWYCEDSDTKCRPGQISGVTSNAFESRTSAYHNAHTTIWCSEFFNIGTLKDQTDFYFESESNHTIIDNFDINRGTIMLHEIWKYEHLVCHPRTHPEKLFIQEDRADQIWDLASHEGTKSAYVTADSYTMDALAVYLQQLFSSAIPAVPRSQAPGPQAPQ